MGFPESAMAVDSKRDGRFIESATVTCFYGLE